MRVFRIRNNFDMAYSINVLVKKGSLPLLTMRTCRVLYPHLVLKK